MFIRIAAYHVQQTRLGLLASEDVDSTGDTEQDGDAVVKMEELEKKDDDAIVSQIKVSISLRNTKCQEVLRKSGGNCNFALLFP